MISYCIAVYRPVYARLLLEELQRKTSAPFEILVWLNVQDAGLEADIATARAAGVALRVVGRTPENIGMRSYRQLFRAARYPLIVQIDDDVVCISRGIAERACRLFRRHPKVRQLVADVWQDEFTTGARPPMTQYQPFDAGTGLYRGPIDGWFSVYHGSVLPMLMSLPSSQYFNLGSAACARLAQQGLLGLLDRGMKVFHVVGPAYASAFGMLDFEIDKYRRLGRLEIVEWYERERGAGVSPQDLAERVQGIRASLEGASAAAPWT